MTSIYKYEVAFSFHSKDEALAQQLSDLLSDRVSTFIYSEQQQVLAGRDGEVVFNAVFGSEARVVVVLHREEWELSPKVGDGGNRKGGISWGCLTPPLLHQRSDMPCPKITSSS